MLTQSLATPSHTREASTRLVHGLTSVKRRRRRIIGLHLGLLVEPGEPLSHRSAGVRSSRIFAKTHPSRLGSENAGNCDLTKLRSRDTECSIASWLSVILPLHCFFVLAAQTEISVQYSEFLRQPYPLRINLSYLAVGVVALHGTTRIRQSSTQ